eukprot:g9936.t1 g9936   contig4:911082-911582(+)
MNTLLVLLFLSAALAGDAAQHNYPQTALQCYASSAINSQKDGSIICPQDRNNVCIKEVINSSRADCGNAEGTPYFGRDVWDIKLAQCVYRKCAAECPTLEEDQARTFGGDYFVVGSASTTSIGRQQTPVFNRTSYCCTDNLCNSGERTMTTFMTSLSMLWLFRRVR